MSRLIPFVAAIGVVLAACGGTDAESTPVTSSASVVDPTVVTTAATQTTLATEGSAVSTSVPEGPVVTASVPQPQVQLDRVEHGFWFEGGWTSSVAVGGPGLMAAGAAAGYYTDAAMWTSTDGDTWVRIDDDPSVFGDESSANGTEGNQVITDLVSGSLGVVAVGADGKPGDYDAAVWVSADGLVWERLPHDEDVFGGEGDQIIRSVVQTERAVVAVGESGGHATVWASNDGRDWTRSMVEGTANGIGTEPSAMIDVSLGGPGLVAVGSAGLESRPAVWLSAEGSMWSRLPNDTSSGSSGVEIGESTVAQMALVAAGESGLVAIGTAAAGPVVWASVDGFEWFMLDAKFTDGPPGTRASPSAVAWDGDRLVAVGGYEGTPGWCGSCFVTMWVSVDGGVTWELGGERDVDLGAAGISDTPMPSAPSLTHFGSSFVVVGNDSVATEDVINGYVQHARIVAVWVASLTEE